MNANNGSVNFIFNCELDILKRHRHIKETQLYDFNSVWVLSGNDDTYNITGASLNYGILGVKLKAPWCQYLHTSREITVKFS